MSKALYWERFLSDEDRARMRREVDDAPINERRLVLLAWRATALATWDTARRGDDPRYVTEEPVEIPRPDFANLGRGVAERDRASLEMLRAYDAGILETMLAAETRPLTVSVVLQIVDRWLEANKPSGGWYEADQYEYADELRASLRSGCPPSDEGGSGHAKPAVTGSSAVRPKQAGA